MPTRSAALLGATGLVGGHVLRLLLEDPDRGKVAVLTRRSLGLSSPKLVEHIVDFDDPKGHRGDLAADDVFCCLGTTIKKAGSEEAFRKVDHEYPLVAARRALEEGARQYLIVTAVGADPKSRIFYNRVKGEVEGALRDLPFREGVKLFHPSMLLGDRTESRPAERAAAAVMKVTGPLFAGALKRYRAIDASLVARAMVNAARHAEPGVKTYEGESLFAIAGEGPSA
jgi:uncharacterized protein YbjT (DUF2867 family)